MKIIKDGITIGLQLECAAWDCVFQTSASDRPLAVSGMENWITLVYECPQCSSEIQVSVQNIAERLRKSPVGQEELSSVVY